MKIKMKNTTRGSIDGQPKMYMAGEVYDMSETDEHKALAELFVKAGDADKSNARGGRKKDAKPTYEPEPTEGG